MILKLQPEDFIAVHLGTASRLIFRLCASFCGVLGFSIMFNSSIPMASTAAMIGAVANTLRLSLIDFTGMPAAVAAFTGALAAGLLASLIKKTTDIQEFHLQFLQLLLWCRDCIFIEDFITLESCP